MSSHFGVRQTSELLEKLRSTVEDFAAREQKLKQEHAAAIHAAGERQNRATDQATDRFASERAQVQDTFLEDQTQAEARYTQRKARLVVAHRSSKKSALQKIEREEGNRKHKLQTDTLQAQRNHDTGITKTEKAFAEFRRTLTGEHDAIAALDARAQRAFSGFGKLVRLFSQPKDHTEADLARDEYHLIAELRELLNKTESDLVQFEKRLLPRIFKLRWFLLFLALCLIPLVPALHYFGYTTFTYETAGATAGGVVVLGFAAHYLAQRQLRPVAQKLSGNLARARQLDDLCFGKSDARRARDLERIENELKSRKAAIEQEWIRTVDDAARARESRPAEVDAKNARAVKRHDRLHQSALARLEKKKEAALLQLQQQADEEKKRLHMTVEERKAAADADFQTKLAALEAEWKARIIPLYETVREVQAEAATLFPEAEAAWKNWKPPGKFEHAARFGHLEVDLATFAGAVPKDERLSLPGPAELDLPLALQYPGEGSLLIETKETGRDEAIAALNNTVLRLLSVSAPGRLSFTVIDPVGLGQSFSGIMHLADYAEHLINSHIWTQPGQIEEKLADLNEHMEKVIQMYLRNEYATIAEYNKQAGNIAEKYHFLVAADFPANFSDTAAKRLLNIANSGARCGVYTLIHWNQNQPQPADFLPDELRKSSVNLVCKGHRFTLVGKNFPGTELKLDAPPAAEVVTEFIHKVGQSNRDSNRVEVPFEHVAPPDAQLWSEETTNELRVPIGRTGATKLQYLAIGKGTRQHALIAGKTGSGKSTLFHVIITNLALWCQPGTGGVLPDRFQERRRVQMLRGKETAARPRRRHRERSRIRPERSAARR